MNVGFFSPTLNKIGGGELVTLNMIRALAERNHKIIVYSAEEINQANIQNFLGEKIRFDKEVIIRPNLIDPYALENIYLNLWKSFLFHFKCDFLIDTFSDAVYPWANAVYFHKNARMTRLPRSFKGTLFMPYKVFLNTSIKFQSPIEKTLMTCSKFTAKTIEASTGQVVNVLYPPVSDFFMIRNNISAKTSTVVTVTRLSADKRPETIAQIAKLLPDDILFIVVGSCQTSSEWHVLKTLREYIQKLGVNTKMQLLLNISREKQREILQNARIYLHPFVPYEAFGISVVEAMSAGCIPIVPDIGGLKEIVPKQLRYHSLSEAASLIKESLANWSSSKARDSVKTSHKFSQARFCKEFLKLMKL